MKICSWIFRSHLSHCIVLTLVLSGSSLYGQPAPINGNLTGSNTIGTVNVETSGGTQYNVSATPEGIYIKNSETSDIDYVKIYSPPSGKSIQRIEVKIDTIGPFNFPRNRLRSLVLLNDGTVLIFDFSNYSTSRGAAITDLGKPDTGGLVSTWNQVLGDALYLVGGSVYVSRDTGKTWQIDTAGFGSGVYGRDLVLDSSEYVYAATTGGLFKQHPDSSIWHKVTTFTGPTSLTAVFIDRRNRIFVVGNGGTGIFLSTDNGLSWNIDSTGVGGLTLSVFSDDAFGNIYASGGNGTIFKSAGGTGVWTRIDADISTITVNPPFINALRGDSLLIAATNFGLFVSSDQGSTWYEDNNGIQAGTFYGFAKNNPERFFVSTDLGIFYNDAGDTAWHKSFPPSGYQGSLPIYKDSGQTLYTVLPNTVLNSTALGPIYKSTDNGLTWIPDTMGLSATVGRVFFVDERGGEHIGSSYDGGSYYARVYAQDINGNWILDTNGIPNANLSYARSFGTDRAGLIYLSGVYQGNPRVLHRAITGGNWVVDTVGLPATVSNFTTMRQGAVGDVFGTNGASLYRHNTGVWSQVPLPGPTISKFSVDKIGTIFVVNTTVIGFVIAEVGISMSTDNGTTWTALTHDTMQVAALHSHGDTSYALLQGGGLYTLTKNGIVTSVSARQTAQLPVTYQLSQNYPNPFNPTTTFGFAVPTQSKVKLNIYNILGQVVATLVNGVVNAGYQTAHWNASNVASGVYFYRIEATSIANPSKTFMQVKKMVLMK